MQNLWSFVGVACAVIIFFLSESGTTGTSRFSSLNKANYDEPYIHVFGRNSCGYTTALLKKLNQANVAYQYFNFDENEVLDYVFRLRDSAGYRGDYTDIPVVDFNRKVIIRPNAESLISSFSKREVSSGDHGLADYH